MSNSKFRCAQCKDYFPQPGVRRGLGQVCSSCAGAPVFNDRSSPPASSRPRARKPSRFRPVKNPMPSEVHDAVMRRDRGRCRMCASEQDLHVHHINYRSEGVDHQVHNLIVLCGSRAPNHCHDRVHSDKRRWKPACLAYIWCLYTQGRQVASIVSFDPGPRP